MRACLPALLLGVVLATTAAAQSNPNGQLPVTQFPQPYLFLIRDPVVHSDLNVDSKQKEAIRKLSDELDVGLWSMRNKSSDHIQRTVTASMTKAKQRMSEILTRDQNRRLEQIVLRTTGLKAILSPNVVKYLQLSTDTQNSIKEKLAETKEAMSKLSEKLKTGGARESLDREARQLQTDEYKAVLAMLTREQQRKWQVMLGKRIDLAKLGRVRFKAPTLKGDNAWINSQPLSLEQLKGKVVALHFFAFA